MKKMKEVKAQQPVNHYSFYCYLEFNLLHLLSEKLISHEHADDYSYPLIKDGKCTKKY